MIHSWLKMSIGDETSSCFFISGAAEFDDRPGIVRDALIQSVEDWRTALRRATAHAGHVEIPHVSTSCRRDSVRDGAFA